jgi:hypothetical protein
MSNFNFKIHSLHFSCKSEFNLKIEISGSNFPKPDNPDGVLEGNNITFDLKSTNGKVTNKFCFEFTDSSINETYNFNFINYPDGQDDGMHGAVSTTIEDSNGLFDLEHCSFEELPNGEVEIDLQRVSPMIKKGGSLQVKKKPTATKMYKCIGISLNPNNTALVMTFLEAEEDKLYGEITDIPDSCFVEGLGLATSVVDGNPEPREIGAVCMAD